MTFDVKYVPLQFEEHCPLVLSDTVSAASKQLTMQDNANKMDAEKNPNAMLFSKFLCLLKCYLFFLSWLR